MTKPTSSTRCAWYVRYSQDFLTRAQYMYKKHFHNAKSWPLCCISPAPAPSAITLLHRKWLKGTHEVLNFWDSRNLKSRSHIFKFLYIAQLSYKRKLHNPKASAIKFFNCVTPAGGWIFEDEFFYHFPRLTFLKVSSRTAISPDFALFFK